MNNFQQIMLILATPDWDDGGPVFSDADLHDIEKHVRAMQAEIEQLRAARPSPDAGLVEALIEALEPVRLIHAEEPTAASGDFDRGAPLTKSQIRKMQAALAAMRTGFGWCRGSGGRAVEGSEKQWP